jgi:hypothetical protein
MSAPQGKVIITCAVTGSIHTPSMSPYLQVTPDEIGEAANVAATDRHWSLYTRAIRTAARRRTRSSSGSSAEDQAAWMSW